VPVLRWSQAGQRVRRRSVLGAGVEGQLGIGAVALHSRAMRAQRAPSFVFLADPMAGDHMTMKVPSSEGKSRVLAYVPPDFKRCKRESFAGTHAKS